MTSFAGRIVVITGAARGQGAAHAELFAERGATVYALDLRDDLGAELEKELRGKGLDVTYRHHDVTSQDDWAALVADVEKAHGTLDVLVGNAGIVHTTNIPDETVEAFELTLRVNTTGVFLGMHTCWQLLSAGDGGAIVNISSVYGLHSNPGYVAYTASKAAVIGMTKTAAIEGATVGIRANVVSPGAVQTEMLKDEKHSFVRDATPMDRGAHVSEISRAVAYLASPEASFVTGVELTVDGGFAAH